MEAVLANILPPSTSLGIICILENSFNQTLTYRIDGPDVTYLGGGGSTPDMITWKRMPTSTRMLKARQT
jgi:hypothetical protein